MDKIIEYLSYIGKVIERNPHWGGRLLERIPGQIRDVADSLDDDPEGGFLNAIARDFYEAHILLEGKDLPLAA